MLTIDDNLLKDIENYCKINNIADINKEINSFLRKGFNLSKFGSSPFERIKMEKQPNEEKAIMPQKETFIEPLQEETKEVTITQEKPHDEPKNEEILQTNTTTTTATTVSEIKEVKPKRKYTRKVRLLKDE